MSRENQLVLKNGEKGIFYLWTVAEFVARSFIFYLKSIFKSRSVSLGSINLFIFYKLSYK